MSEKRFPQDVVTSHWKNGKTLPVEASDEYPFIEQELVDDNGMNVLVDLAHQCNFTTMWKMKGVLNENGYRYISTHACLDTVLTPGVESRVRIKTGEAEDGKAIRPFSMWRNVAYNTIITMQADMRAQEYLPEELDAVERFVESGGGLVIIAGVPGRKTMDVDPDAYADWPLRRLLQRFGGDVSDQPETGNGVPMLGLAVNGWEVVQTGENDLPVAARKVVGKGRVVVLASTALILKAVHYDSDPSAEEEQRRLNLFRESLAWASAGKPPVGGSACLPSTYGGGGSIYPEISRAFGNIVLFYAKNQKQEVLDMVDRDYPSIEKDLFAWLPSEKTVEPMYILMASGMGGGWAVNAFWPKENGIAAYDRLGVLQIYAHELAHTMAGPVPEGGVAAANWFDGNQGEAHAGWFQGKIIAKYTDDKTMRKCNSKLFDADGNFIPFDFADEEQRGGKIWTHLWYTWQRLDETYGTTWYPRWRWVQYSRWADEPNRELTVDEWVEDMSIAVGEDLFPFVKSMGTGLGRERLERTEFMGETIDLPVAEIEIKPAGNALLDPIEDFTRPLAPRRRP